MLRYAEKCTPSVASERNNTTNNKACWISTTKVQNFYIESQFVSANLPTYKSYTILSLRDNGVITNWLNIHAQKIATNWSFCMNAWQFIPCKYPRFIFNHLKSKTSQTFPHDSDQGRSSAQLACKVPGPSLISTHLKSVSFSSQLDNILQES